MMDYAELCKAMADAADCDGLVRVLVRALPGSSREDNRAAVSQALRAAIDRICGQKPSDRAAHSQRLEAIGQMAAAISHELRNPLSGIKLTAEYLIKKLQNEPDLVEVISNIHNEVMYANTVISNILEHAKVLKPQRGRVNLLRALDEALMTVAQQGCFRDIQVVKEYPERMPMLLLDAIQMRQIFMNLFMNAAEAMLGGGELRISVCCGATGVTVEVKDTGPGIAPERIAQIFEPFYTTKVKGIGIGLAVVKEMIENHGGRIGVESKKAKGTVIRVSLPLPPETGDSAGVTAVSDTHE